ncbi:electron transfer flavoprotein subunit alpha/FixB family protein [Neobacillus sp. KR4-4]|uniref:electron transfer flavoprotein subunit alpha/FixB family protein n=1 Tax=Neobacillus sp. KR4-4 TaxID=3344872 RepID=UPI0035CA4A1F
MESNVFCYLPVKNGLSFTKETWGMIEWAKKIRTEKTKMIAIIVHTGIQSDELKRLPFDEVYHVKLDIKKWKIADYHIQAFRKIRATISDQKGIYLFSSHPLYHEIAVRASTRYEGSIITNAIEVTWDKTEASSLLVKREIYKEKAHEFVTFLDEKQQYLTLENSILYGTEQYGKPNFVQEIDIEPHILSPIQFLLEEQVDWKELKITEARVVIGIGRGVNNGNTIDSILQLAEILNAPIGGSKVADELGLIPREKRIGASGSTIDSDIYIAIGISGSSQHLEGIKGVKHVIAINNDPSAAIFQRCDIGIVGDYEEVVPRLIESLQAERQGEVNVKHLHIG